MPSLIPVGAHRRDQPIHLIRAHHPAEAEAIKEAAARVLRGERIRSIAFDFNDRGIK